MTELKKKPLFNPEGDPDVRLRRMIGGNSLKAFITCAAALRSPVTMSAAEATPESVAVADCTRL